MTKTQWLRKTHKWLALFAGLQILIWSISGLYMTFVDLDVIHGDHLVNLNKPQVIDSSKLKPISIELIKELAKNENSIKSINLKMVFGQPIYDVRTKKSRVIIDGLTGEQRETVSQTVIEQQANEIYAGTAKVSNIVLLEKYPAEIGGRTQPVWQVNYDDWLRSTLYFEHDSGRLLSKRSDLWRAFDFLWILHIMEYWGSDGYEGLLFRIFSILSLLMALVGSWLLYYRMGSSDSVSKDSNTKLFSLLSSFKRLHKWFALLIGIQLFIWIVSGLVFSFIDHKNVKGSFIVQTNQESKMVVAERFSEFTNLYPSATSITQFSLLEQSVLKVEYLKLGSKKNKKETLLINAKSKQLIKVNELLIKQTAKQYYQGGGSLTEIKLVNERNDENRDFKLPVWQLIYDDEFESQLYYSNTSAQFLGIRTESWRTFDFFMMLHFMDYSFLGLDLFETGERGNFNNGLIIFSALALLLFSFSGMLLITSAFSKSDFVGLFSRFSSSRKITIKLLDENGLSKEIKVEPNHRLIDILSDNGIQLESICGGGGICGCCKVKLIGQCDGQLDLSDHDYLDDDELKTGYRLACQLSVDGDVSVEVPEGVL